MARKLALALLAFVLAIAFVAYKRSKQLRAPQEFSGAYSPSEWASTPGPSPSAVTANARMASAPRGEWERFREDFGPDFEPTYLRGALVSVRKAGNVAHAPGAFDLREAQQVIARARTILEALHSELNIAPESTLDNPYFQGTEHSAQVHFKQSFGGVPVSPFGGVTVLLGPGGELERLDSSTLPAVKVTNQVVLSSDQARAHAVQAFFSGQSDWRAGPPVEGGAHVIWVPRPLSDNGPAEGRHAYDFNIGGDQFVIDAATGEVLYRKSQRRH